VKCTVCRLPPGGTYELSLHGEVTCVSHVVADRCVLCARPRSENSSGWLRFTGEALRCPTCVQQAVETQEQARAHIPLVRRDMARIGIELSTRVAVRLRDPGSLGFRTGANGIDVRLGVTRSERWIGSGSSVVMGIEIARGLTEVHFGAVLAHELGHAWLIQRGAGDLEPVLAEGTCELFAGAWLKQRSGSLARALRESMRTNPDPVYGTGYRLVRDAVLRHGIALVLDSICRRRRLP
jgi:Protein DA1